MTATIQNDHIPFIQKVLRKTPIFSRLHQDEQRTLSLQMRLRHFKKGAKIIQENEKMDWFGIIWKGAVISNNQQILKQGDCLGEEVLVNDFDTISDNTIKCIHDTEIFSISQNEFSKLFSNRLSFNWRTSASNDSLNELEDDSRKKERRDAKAETFTAVSVSEQQARAKSSQLKTTVLNKWLKDQLKQNVLFKSLSEELLDAIVDNLYCIDVAADNILIKQGDMGHVLYIVEKGMIEVFIDDKPIPVAIMQKGHCVGELSLMFDCPRAATCKTKTECKLWCIDRNDFKITLRREAQKELQKIADFLKTVPILKLLSDAERNRIATCLNVTHCQKNKVIIKEGEMCDDEMKSKFYILKKGKAVAYKKINGKQVNVKNYGANEYFGERALITNEARAATIQAIADCELLTLSRSEFVKTMSSVKLVIQNRMKNYEKAPTMSSTQKKIGFLSKFRHSHDNYNDKLRRNYSLKRSAKDYKFIHGIGQGSFATVWLVRDKLNKQTYALKRMSKKGIEDTQQQQHVANERTILSSVDCRFVVKLFCTFQDESNVYMVLDLGLGGDMFTYLESQGRLGEEKALFFMGCVVLAFEYLHLKEIVYRDLKPENLVFDFRGYLKLCDLGFAKKLNVLNSTESERTYTVCGTPVYLAPEVIIGKGHSFPVDWWTSGIFLYEMITGYPPFDQNNLVDTYDAILHKAPRYKQKYFKSRYVIDLLQGLLKKKPNHRYGHSVIDINARIKKHKWFRNLNWLKLASGEIPSPYRPRLKNDYDIKYFDQDIEQRKYENVGKPKNPDAEWLQSF